MENEYGLWAGTVMCHADVDDVRQWCRDTIKNSDRNIYLKYYGDGLCGLVVRHKKDLMLARLKWL